LLHHNMATVYNCTMATAAAWVLNERIIHHSQSGGLLEGLKFDKEGTYDVDGESDLPLLQPLAVSLTEKVGPGFGASGAQGKNGTISPTWTMTYRLATSRRRLLFRRNPDVISEPKGFMEWACAIIDAMEINQDGALDAGLEGSIESPMLVNIGENTASQLSFQGIMQVVLHTKNHCRGERSFTLPE